MITLIKGIKVHRGRCWECPCLDGEYGDCNVLEKDVHYVSDEECPIIELPDHGDLIDRNELLKKEAFIGDTWSGGFAVLSEDIYSATAVIPAERSEDDRE